MPVFEVFVVDAFVKPMGLSSPIVSRGGGASGSGSAIESFRPVLEN